MRRLALTLCVVASASGCDEPAPTPAPASPAPAPCAVLTPDCPADDACAQLFGLPSARTGLPADACAPTCACADDVWRPRAWDAALLAELRAHVLLNPPARLEDDPYAAPAPDPIPGAVCGATFTDDGYRLTTFVSAEDAHAEGAYVTHHRACGQCSSLQDLAIYMGTPDLTEPVRACGILGITQGDEAQLECLLDVGFSPACADIWAYNTSHTRAQCAAVCLPLLDAPYHTADGSPNACIQCDEDLSGPVFKAVSGRTRRNSGLPTALCRPCESVAPVSHDYPAPPAAP